MDHTRALDADERIHRARAEAGSTLMSNENEHPVDGVPESEHAASGKDMSRRDALQLLAALPVAAFLSWPTAEQEKASRFVDNALRSAAEGTPFATQCFTPADFRVVRDL